MRRFRSLVFVVGAVAACAQDPLAGGFRNPPASARPRVWWHWMNGNITKAGIQADLEWMKRAGLGGFQNFDAALATPQIVDKRLVFMTPEWKDAFRFTAELAAKLGLEMAIAGSPGWSESGGPWVPPAQAMKKYVWSETRVEGGRPFSAKLAKPPSTSGPYQNLEGRGALADLMGGDHPFPEYYADAAVIAFREAAGEAPFAGLQPKITSSGGTFNAAQLSDGDLTAFSPLPKAPQGEKAWIQFEFATPITVQAITFALARSQRNPFMSVADSGQELESSNDGQSFRPVVKLPAAGAPANTLAFEPVTARYFRVTLKTLPSVPFLDIPGFNAPKPPNHFAVSEIVLHTGPRVHRFQEKAAFVPFAGLYNFPTPRANAAVSRSQVIDLTAKMAPDGTLNWTPPPGQWTILRLGYSLLGISNHPASPEATGPEVDKLSRPAVRAYFENYLDQYKDAAGPYMGSQGLTHVITDSWEAGGLNWTDDMIAQFNRRRGYDLKPWIPVLTGRVVESAEASDRVLFDFRRTIADLIAENHYDQLTEILKARGMSRYTESHENGRQIIADGMEIKRGAAVPMSATWTPRPGEKGENFGAAADVRESASVAHLYGQNLVAAESLTAIGTPWQWSPETLKPTADFEMANGLNRFVIHTSVHQPVNDKVPGLGLGPFGQWFTRHETWAEVARPWVDYLARSSYMLQQGRFAADVLYYYGEDSNITALFGDRSPSVPEGFNFDYVNADALLNRVQASGGKLVTPNGMNYGVLVLDGNSRYMTLAVLKRLAEFASQGVKIAGERPIASPSQQDDQQEFQRIATRLWDGKQIVASPLDVLKEPDFTYAKPLADTKLAFVHRTLPDGEVYWISNRQHRVEALEASFRVSGKAAEFWYPESGKTAPASYRTEGRRTIVPLQLDPDEAVFVVFRSAAASPSRMIPKPAETVIATLDGEWSVAFQSGRGAPEQATFSGLESWSAIATPGSSIFREPRPIPSNSQSLPEAKSGLS